VIDEGLVGSPDIDVIAACKAEIRCLITLDLDFSDMRAYSPSDHFGVIVLRLHRQDKTHVLDIAHRLIPLLETEPLERRLWIVDERRVRIRGGE
jgi:predicted nuclease of predicted toxin-antitoxin system